MVNGGARYSGVLVCGVRRIHPVAPWWAMDGYVPLSVFENFRFFPCAATPVPFPPPAGRAHHLTHTGTERLLLFRIS